MNECKLCGEKVKDSDNFIWCEKCRNKAQTDDRDRKNENLVYEKGQLVY